MRRSEPMGENGPVVQNYDEETRTVITHCMAYQRRSCLRTEDIFPTDDRECTGN
jgi:hypothetical protein